MVKFEKNSASRGIKCKEPDTPDLGSEGASAPIWKQVKFEGVTPCHGPTLGIHIGASLHNMDEKDKDVNDREGEEGEDDDNTPGETPKGENKEGEDDDDDI